MCDPSGRERSSGTITLPQRTVWPATIPVGRSKEQAVGTNDGGTPFWANAGAEVPLTASVRMANVSARLVQRIGPRIVVNMAPYLRLHVGSVVEARSMTIRSRYLPLQRNLLQVPSLTQP